MNGTNRVLERFGVGDALKGLHCDAGIADASIARRRANQDPECKQLHLGISDAVKPPTWSVCTHISIYIYTYIYIYILTAGRRRENINNEVARYDRFFSPGQNHGLSCTSGDVHTLNPGQYPSYLSQLLMVQRLVPSASSTSPRTLRTPVPQFLPPGRELELLP